jgi:tetratricopeptide (TPR) repeat protein
MLDLRDRLAAAVAPRYIVDRELAAGGMGVVFLGHDPTLGREVAIKVLPPEHATAIAVERFLREARLLARLAHPHIVTILEAHQAGELLWFVMPRIEGDTLADRLAKGPLAAGEVRRLGMDLLSALEHAHRHGVIHRDIKPANIFLQSSRGLLADFGIAQLDSSAGESLTAANQRVGTPRYMAPEQLSTGEVTERSDLYALGATLYEAASGARWKPMEAGDSRTWRVVPKRLRSALRGVLHADPAKRWPTAEAFRLELAASRRRGVPWVVLATATILAVVGFVMGRRLFAAHAVPGLSHGQRKAALVVLPFEGGTAGLDTNLARLTSFQLEAAPIPSGVFPASRIKGMDRDAAFRIAQHVVEGSIAAHGDQADVLLLTIYDSAGRGTSLRVPSNGADAAVWGRAVADTIVSRLFQQELVEFRQMGASPKLDALTAYESAQELFQHGDWSAAERKFADAEAIDPRLFQASWGRLLARQWQRKPFEADMARLAERFPPPLDELARIQLEPDIERRLARYDSLALKYPNYATVREMQANELFGRGPLAGRPLREGIDSFRSLAQHFPSLDEATTYTQTVWGLVRLGDRGLAVEQYARRKTKALSDDLWTNMLWLAIKGRFQRWLAAPARDFMLWRADSSLIAMLHQAVRLGLEVDDPLDQLAIGAALERHRGTTDSLKASALAAQATALLLLGRPAAALARLDSGAALVPGNGGYRLQLAEWRVLLPLLPGAPIAIAARERDAGRRQLRQVEPADSLLWPRAAWALAIDAVERGDGHGRDSLLTLLRARSAVLGVADLVMFADALVLGTAGRVDSALALSRRIYRIPSESEASVRGPLVRALMYLHRGAWQQLRGNPSGAESEWLWHENNDVQGWPSRDPEEGELDAALSAVARLLRAENLLKLDRRSQACAFFERVHKLWTDAEAAFGMLQARVAKGQRQCRG